MDADELVGEVWKMEDGGWVEREESKQKTTEVRR